MLDSCSMGRNGLGPWDEIGVVLHIWEVGTAALSGAQAAPVVTWLCVWFQPASSASPALGYFTLVRMLTSRIGSINSFSKEWISFYKSVPIFPGNSIWNSPVPSEVKLLSLLSFHDVLSRDTCRSDEPLFWFRDTYVLCVKVILKALTCWMALFFFLQEEGEKCTWK